MRYSAENKGIGRVYRMWSKGLNLPPCKRPRRKRLVPQNNTGMVFPCRRMDQSSGGFSADPNDQPNLVPSDTDRPVCKVQKRFLCGGNAPYKRTA